MDVDMHEKRIDSQHHLEVLFDPTFAYMIFCSERPGLAGSASASFAAPLPMTSQSQAIMQYNSCPPQAPASHLHPVFIHPIPINLFRCSCTEAKTGNRPTAELQ